MELLLVSCDLSETVRADLTPSDDSCSSNEDKLSDLFLENVARDSDPNSRLGTDFTLSGNGRSSNKCSDDSDLSSLEDEGDSNSSSPETSVLSLVSRVRNNSPSRKLPLLAEETSLSSNELFDSLSGDLLREN